MPRPAFHIIQEPKGEFEPQERKKLEEMCNDYVLSSCAPRKGRAPIIDGEVLRKIERVHKQRKDPPTFASVVKTNRHKDHEREIRRECRAYVLSYQYGKVPAAIRCADLPRLQACTQTHT